MAKPTIQEVDDGVILEVKVVPGSSRTCMCGLLDGILKIKVAAAPEKGKANQCLIEYLAKQLGVKRNSVNIITGKHSPVKHIQILGVSAKTLLKKLNLNKLSS